MLELVIHFFFHQTCKGHAHRSHLTRKYTYYICRIHRPIYVRIGYLPKHAVYQVPCCHSYVSVARTLMAHDWVLFYLEKRFYLVKMGTSQRLGLLPKTSLKLLKRPIEKPFLSAPPRNIGALNDSEIVEYKMVLVFVQLWCLKAD